MPLDFHIFDRWHRTENDGPAEAALWCARWLVQWAEAQRRELAGGRPAPPAGLPGPADFARLYDARARHLVELARAAPGYLGETSKQQPLTTPKDPR